MFLCISPGMPFNTLLMLCHYFYFRASLNYFYWTMWRKGHKGKLWLVFIAPMFNAKMALNNGGNTPFSKVCTFQQKETISPNLKIGVEILHSSLLWALMIYNVLKHRFVLHFLWCFLYTFIPILIEKKNFNCSSVSYLSVSHGFIFVYWGMLCCLGT